MKKEVVIPYEQRRYAELEELYKRALALKDLSVSPFGEAIAPLGADEVFILILADFQINLNGPMARINKESYYQTNVDSVFLKLLNRQRTLVKFGVLKLRSLNLVFK